MIFKSLRILKMINTSKVLKQVLIFWGCIKIPTHTIFVKIVVFVQIKYVFYGV